MRHVIDNHVGTSSLYKTLSHIIMFEVDKKEERERERIYLVELTFCLRPYSRMLSQKMKTAILSWCQRQSRLAIVLRQSQLRLGPEDFPTPMG